MFHEITQYLGFALLPVQFVTAYRMVSLEMSPKIILTRVCEADRRCGKHWSTGPSALVRTTTHLCEDEPAKATKRMRWVQGMLVVTPNPEQLRRISGGIET